MIKLLITFFKKIFLFTKDLLYLYIQFKQYTYENQNRKQIRNSKDR